MFLSTATIEKVNELARELVRPEQVDAAILRLQQHRARSWPHTRLAAQFPPDVLRELGDIHNQLVQGDDVHISPGSHQAAQIAAAMASVLGRSVSQEVHGN